MYDAFISYSQKRDTPIAQALRTVIQSVGKPWWHRRSLSIFLDATSLAAAPGLRSELERKLGDSRHMILLASREAATSVWVDKEVAFFLASPGKGVDHILIAMTDGELVWDRTGGDFVWNERTPLPPSLRGRFVEEPLWVDLRPYREAPQQANKKNAEFLDRALRLAATIRGVAKEDLYSEELRHQRRNLAWAYGAAGGLLLIAVTAGILGYAANEQRKVAEEQRRVALSRALALEAREARGDPELAIRLSMEALSVRDTLEARRSLIQMAELALGEKSVSYRCCAADAISAIAFSDSGEQVFAGDNKGNIYRWYPKEDEPVALGEPLEGTVLHIKVADDGKRLVAITTKQGAYFDIESNPPKQLLIELPGASISTATLSKDGNRLAAGDAMGRITVLDRRVNTWSAPFSDVNLKKTVTSLAFHPSGALLAASYGVDPVPGFEQPIVFWDVLTGQRVEPSFRGHRGEVMSIDFSPDGKQLASGSWDHDVRVWDTITGDTIPPVFVGSAHDSRHSGTSFARVAVSPDGKVLASVMGDTVALWSMTEHKLLAQFTGRIHTTVLAFDPKGTHLAVGGEDRNTVLILVDFRYWLKRACRSGVPGLTADQKRYYVGEAREQGPFAKWLWEVYSSMRSPFGEAQHQRRGEVDPCADVGG